MCCLYKKRPSEPFLAAKGCTFEAGKGDHMIVRRGNLRSVLPMHGGPSGASASPPECRVGRIDLAAVVTQAAVAVLRQQQRPVEIDKTRTLRDQQ